MVATILVLWEGSWHHDAPSWQLVSWQLPADPLSATGCQLTATRGSAASAPGASAPNEDPRYMIPRRENRNVIRLRRGAGEFAHGVQRLADDVGRGARVERAEQRQQAILAEELVAQVHRLADAVREEHERIAGLEGHRLGRDRVERHEAGRAPGRSEGEARRLARRQDGQLVVPGARARHPLRGQVEHEALDRDEHAARILLGEFVVQALQDLRRIGDAAGQRAEDGDGHRHEECGREPFTRHVAQRDDHAVVGGAEDFVEIAAHLPGRLDDRLDVEVRAARRRIQADGEEPHLDLAGDPELPCDGLQARVQGARHVAEFAGSLRRSPFERRGRPPSFVARCRAAPSSRAGRTDRPRATSGRDTPAPRPAGCRGCGRGTPTRRRSRSSSGCRSPGTPSTFRGPDLTRVKANNRSTSSAPVAR